MFLLRKRVWVLSEPLWSETLTLWSMNHQEVTECKWSMSMAGKNMLLFPSTREDIFIFIKQ